MKKTSITLAAAILALSLSTSALAAPVSGSPSATCNTPTVLCPVADCTDASCKTKASDCNASKAKCDINSAFGKSCGSTKAASSALPGNLIDLLKKCGISDNMLKLLEKCLGNNQLPQPTATPCPTPVVTPAPTEKPVPTATPKPTATPTPTATPKPSATPAPTATPKPSATPAPTATPKPSATPAPTATPKPSATPAPTATPKPSATPAPTSTPVPNDNAENRAFEEQVVTLVNEQRAANGLSALTLDNKLSDVARAKSRDMRDLGYFSHTSPTYGSPFDMLKAFGISYRTAGENIAYGYATPEAVVTAWMNSPGHRANILNSSYTKIGVGYVAKGHYWTQHFIG